MFELTPHASWWNKAPKAPVGKQSRDCGILGHCIGDESPWGSVAAYAVKIKLRVAAWTLVVSSLRGDLLHTIEPFEPAAGSDHMATWKDLCTMRWSVNIGMIWLVWTCSH
jgi:hypothetical protein